MAEGRLTTETFATWAGSFFEDKKDLDMLRRLILVLCGIVVATGWLAKTDEIGDDDFTILDAASGFAVIDLDLPVDTPVAEEKLPFLVEPSLEVDSAFLLFINLAKELLM